MPTLEHYRRHFLQAKQLCDQRHYTQAHQLAQNVYLESKAIASLYEEQAGLMLVARQLIDISVQAHVLVLFLEKRVGEKNTQVEARV
ncbi:MAG TPA: hypothetical protein VD999_01215 [Vitreimonas sp.]|nr:hypothetical protein [Vitreimonas sp.]